MQAAIQLEPLPKEYIPEEALHGLGLFSVFGDNTDH